MTNEEKLEYIIESQQLTMQYRLWDMPDKTIEEIKELDEQSWQEFSKLLLPKIPKVLYRYRQVNKYSIDELENGYVWFSNPKDFDDGTDSASNTDIEAEMDDFEKNPKDVITRLTKAIISQQYREITGEEINDDFIREGIKCYPNGKIDIDLMKKAFALNCPNINPDPFIKMLESFNNLDGREEIKKPLKGLFDYYMKINELTRSNLLCLCLAEEYSNDVMWAKYAGERTGFCVGYEIPSHDLYSQKILMSLNPIFYGEKKPIRFLNIIIDGISAKESDKINGWTKKTYEELKIATLTKNPDWSFQKEWRIVFDPNVESNKQHFPFVKSIYLGEKMTKENRRLLIGIAKKNNWIIYERKLNKSGSKIIYNQIEEE